MQKYLEYIFFNAMIYLMLLFKSVFFVIINIICTLKKQIKINEGTLSILNIFDI